MAKITAMPQTHIIDQFKGVVDFYEYKGQACARRWPSYKARTPTPSEKANQDSFAYINKVARSLGEYTRKQFVRMAQGTPFSWKDLLVRAYMTGLWP